MRAQKPSKTTGEKYIQWEEDKKHFCVRISLNNKTGIDKFIGRYKTLEEAIICRDKAIEAYLP